MLTPNKFKKNGTVGIFSPSEALGGGRIQRMEQGLDVLRAAGIKFRYSINALTLNCETSAGSIDERIKDIIELLEDPDIEILLGSWGGKSANQLLPYLPYELIKEKKKIISGFSDVAVLLNAITAKTGLITFHGPNVAGKLHESEFGDLRQFNAEFNWKNFNILDLAKCNVLQEGSATGYIFGGNLNCFVVGLIASGFDLSNFEGGIFFFEDLGLTPRVLEQYLFSLRNNGFFDQVSGIVAGQYETPPDNDWMKTSSEDVFLRVLSDFKGPIVTTPFTGHSPLPNPAIPIGALSCLDTRSQSWKIEESEL